jgi:ADP-dependent NAD(P)H-hydrate dehydratase / NAD(P)H-hydrate epimerase
MDKRDWHRFLHRDPDSHKYDYGHVLVIGGSEAMAGAPMLVARAAMRVGAGLVTVASTKDTLDILERSSEEIMTLELPEWHESDHVVAEVDDFIQQRHVSTVVIGPGLPETADEAIRKLVGQLRVTLVLDAQAISALRGHLKLLKNTAQNKSILLTPHSGEFARLTDSELIRDGHVEHTAVSEFAAYYNVTLIVKHRHTLVASTTGELYENTTGNAGLATAGTGDVLSGVLAGVIAQRIESFMAAKMAVYLHGLAGDVVANIKTEPGMMASDVIEALPEALKLLDD